MNHFEVVRDLDSDKEVQNLVRTPTHIIQIASQN